MWNAISLVQELNSYRRVHNTITITPRAPRFIQDGWKAVWSILSVFVAFFPSLKQNFIAYHSSKESLHSDCIFEIHQLWQSGFSRVYSNCCCSCSFEPEIIENGQSSHKMYSNNRLNFQESTTILNACTKKSLETYLMHHVIVLLKFEIPYFELAIQHFSHGNSPTLIALFRLKNPVLAIIYQAELKYIPKRYEAKRKQPRPGQ